MSPDRLEALLAEFPRRRIALVGDLFLDRYLDLTAEREHSIETGLEAYQVGHVRNSPGALGTIINNLAALGAGHLMPVTVVGDDGHGHDLRRCLAALPAVDLQGVLADPERLTPTYIKPLRPAAAGATELNRLDVRTRAPMSDATATRAIEALRHAWAECEGLIVLDQIADAECGVLAAPVRAALARLAAAQPEKLMIVDSRTRLPDFPHGVWKGNRHELLRAAGATDEGDDGAKTPLLSALESLLRDPANAALQAVYCTDGPRGIWVASRDEEITLCPGVPVVGQIDIVGAGDSVTSALTASLLSGATRRESAQLANQAAAISIQKLGETGVATPEELRSGHASR